MRALESFNGDIVLVPSEKGNARMQEQINHTRRVNPPRGRRARARDRDRGMVQYESPVSRHCAIEGRNTSRVFCRRGRRNDDSVYIGPAEITAISRAQKPTCAIFASYPGSLTAVYLTYRREI